jgi:hypothetical protein
MYSINFKKYVQNNSIVVTDNSHDLQFKRNDYDVTFIYNKKSNNHEEDLLAISIPSFLQDEKPEFIKDLYKVYPSTPIFITPHLDELSFAYGYIIGAQHANHS